jgi:GMP synthase (glutamine-hydrolysing)
MDEHSLDAVEAVLRTSRPTPSEPANRHLAMLLWGKALHHDEPAGDASPTAKSFVQTRLQPAAAGTPRMQARDEAAGTSPATAKVYGAKGADQMIREIAAQELDPEHFISAKVKEIADAVGDGMAINALSGGVDSSTVTMLGHRALGQRLKTVFIQNGLMRQGEPEQVVGFFRDLGVAVEVVDAQNEFSAALKGVVDPEEKREAITQTFYREVFGRIVRESGARYLLQGTILTDVDETVAGIKRQHNVFEQLGIDPQEAFGYGILEPLIQLRKDGVRKIGKALGLPAELFERIPFPGPALSARVIGEATPERIETVRKATAVVERLLKGSGAFQYMAILHEDRVTGMRDGKRDFGQQIEVRCWDSVDARTATPTRLSFELLEQVAAELIRDLPGIVSVSYNIAPKPPSTIEAV